MADNYDAAWPDGYQPGAYDPAVTVHTADPRSFVHSKFSGNANSYVAGHQDDATREFRALKTKRTNLDMIPEHQSEVLLGGGDFLSYPAIQMLGCTREQYRLIHNDGAPNRRLGGTKKRRHRGDDAPTKLGADAEEVKKVETGKVKIAEMPGEKWLGRPPFRSMISGASGRGKTTLFSHLYTHCIAPYFDVIILFTPNYVLDDSYRTLDKVRIPDKVFETFTESQFETIIEDARKHVPTVTREDGSVDHAKVKTLQFSTNDLPSVFVGIDDNAFNRDMQKFSYYFEIVIMMGRHLNISVMNLTQKYNKLSRTYRSNVSSLFLFGTENGGELDDMAEEHSSTLLTARQFKKMFNDVTCENPWDFLSIRSGVPISEMFHKGLNGDIDISQYFEGESATFASAEMIGKLKEPGKQPSADEKAPKKFESKWIPPGRVKGPAKVRDPKLTNFFKSLGYE